MGRLWRDWVRRWQELGRDSEEDGVGEALALDVLEEGGKQVGMRCSTSLSL